MDSVKPDIDHVIRWGLDAITHDAVLTYGYYTPNGWRRRADMIDDCYDSILIAIDQASNMP